MISYSSQVVARFTGQKVPAKPFLPCMTAVYRFLGGCCWWVKQRYLVSVLTAFGLTIVLMQRMCMHIIIASVADTDVPVEEGGKYCPQQHNEKPIPGLEVFHGTTGELGVLLAAFYYGYFVTQMPGGIIASKFGAKQIYGAIVVISSASSILTPVAASYGGFVAILIVRIVMGLAQGALYPAITVVVAYWAPPEERGIINSICNAGLPVGIIFGNLLTGVLLDVVKWQVIFYSYGGLGFIWCAHWYILVSKSPEVHPFITPLEAEYIIETIRAESEEPSGGIPWLEMLSSKEFLSNVLANLGWEAGLYLIITEFPLYLAKALRVPTFMNGLLSSIPWILMWLGNLVFGNISICLIQQMPLITVRRLLGGICNFVPAVLWAVVPTSGCNIGVATVLVSGGNFFVGAGYVSFRASFIDNSPNFAGIAMSIAASVAAACGFLVPVAVHALIGEGNKTSDWQISFIFVSLIIILSTIPYLIFVKAEILPWNEGHIPKSKRKPTQRPAPGQPPTEFPDESSLATPEFSATLSADPSQFGGSTITSPTIQGDTFSYTSENPSAIGLFDYPSETVLEDYNPLTLSEPYYDSHENVPSTSNANQSKEENPNKKP